MLGIGHNFIATIIFWANLNLITEKLIKGNTTKDHDFKNRIISIIHGLFAFIYGGYNMLATPNYSQCNAQDDADRFIMIMSCSYFIYDTIACIYFNIYDSKLLIHHLFVIIGYISAYRNEFGAKVGILGLVIGESSNAAMHIRSMLKLYDMKHTKIYAALDILYMATYLVMRGALCPVLIYGAFCCGGIPLIVTASTVMISFQSYYFMFAMYKIIKKLRREQLERNRAGVSLFWFSTNEKLMALDYIKKKEKINLF